MISDLLRLDYDTFVHSAFLQQGRADAFTTKTPAQRKDILGEILGLNQWKTYEERAKETLRQIDHDLSVIDYRLGEIAQQEAEEPALARNLELATAALADATALREEAEARYNEVAGAQEQMNAAQARLAQAEHRIKQRQADLDDIEAELERYAAQIDHLQGVAENRESDSGRLRPASGRARGRPAVGRKTASHEHDQGPAERGRWAHSGRPRRA